MGIFTNRVIAGDYKDADIKLKGLTNKVILKKKGLLTKTEFFIDKRVVDHMELVDKSQTAFDFVGTQTIQAAIYFKNGKKSLCQLDAITYQKINEKLF